MDRAEQPGRGTGRRLALGLVLMTLFVAPVTCARAASAAATVPLRVKASIDSRDADTMDASQPLKLRPGQRVIVDATVTNDSSQSVTVRSISLNGRVMGLAFYSFETRVDLTVAPAATERRTFAVELVGLDGQATGLLPGRLDLLAPNRDVIASKSFATDVRGSPISVYGIFGILVAAITAVLLAAAIVRLAAHRMSIHRWSRGSRFAIPGVGLGLTLTFSLSDFRVLLPKASSWASIVAICAVGFFLLGYLTPTPSGYFDDDVLEDADDRGRRAPSYA